MADIHVLGDRTHIDQIGIRLSEHAMSLGRADVLPALSGRPARRNQDPDDACEAKYFFHILSRADIITVPEDK